MDVNHNKLFTGKLQQQCITKPKKKKKKEAQLNISSQGHSPFRLVYQKHSLSGKAGNGIQV